MTLNEVLSRLWFNIKFPKLDREFELPFINKFYKVRNAYDYTPQEKIKLICETIIPSKSPKYTTLEQGLQAYERLLCVYNKVNLDIDLLASE